MDIARLLGPERLRQIMAEVVNCATSIVQRYGGTVDKFTGDGIMAVFGAPLSLEDHAIRACLAALEIQQEIAPVAAQVKQRDDLDLQLRVGLDSGQVIAGEVGSAALGYTAVGEHVGLAQRMESVAPPGGVMLSASSARLVEKVAALGDPESVHIKGADEPVTARRLLGIGRQRAVTRTESQLVGRNWELSALGGLLDRAIAGQGAVVGISGPAGIGKSRLTRELATMAQARGVDVLTTYSESHTSQVPFNVVKKLFRAATGIEGLEAAAARERLTAQPRDADSEDIMLFEDLLGISDPDVALPLIDPDARRRRLTALVNAASLAVTRAVVYVIEDVHWIDEASESMLADFLEVVPQTPLLTVITYRPDYRGALTRVPGAQTFALAPLNRPETTKLVSGLLGSDPSVSALGEVIIERVAGTPFFAEEIVLELSQRGVLKGRAGSFVATVEAADIAVPATLQTTIASRIDQLNPSSKRTLGAAAVIGSRFSADLLTALGVDPIVDELLATQLIDQVTFTRHPEYVFRQPLIRTVAYETQLKSDRAALHQLVATAIENQAAGSADENAALIAEHLEAAGDLHAAYEWHMRAGAWSNNRDLTAARMSWERARLVADSLPEEHPGRLTMRITPRAALCGTDWKIHADPSSRFDELRQLCALADDKTSLAIAMMGPMAERSQHGDPHGASRWASEQIALLDSIGEPSLTAQAGFGAMGIKSQVAEHKEVIRWAQTTIDWADGDATKGNLIVGSPLAVALALRGAARSWFGLPGWRDDLDAGLAYAKEVGEPLTLAVTMSFKYGSGVYTGALRADRLAVCAGEEVLGVVQSSGNDYAIAMVKWQLGSLLFRRDTAAERDRGLDLVRQARQLSEKQRFLGSELSVMDLFFGLHLVRNGDLDTGIQLLRKSVSDMIIGGQVAYYIPAGCMFVETLIEQGTGHDLAEAGAMIDTLHAAPADGSAVRDVWLLRLHALMARARGDDDLYAALRNRYRDMATSLGFEGHIDWAEAMP
ncbi:cyclase [Mycobacterium gallinarum]|uniref:Cyclase n=2 Tax=Mycobacterium gallinarum TaxID=39689 RepID=A0A9W4FEY7_9MYCO|nr:cyclase [Mycobacterium gallinarum]